MKYVTLNNGVEMPLVGFGTAYLPKGKITNIIGNAYEVGFRKFDTAIAYNNEKEIGDAFNKLGIKREDIFLQTKIGMPSLYYGTFHYGRKRILNVRKLHSIAYEIESSMRRLGTDYIDMFLLHWPDPKFEKLYRELEKFYNSGKIRAIGVCSFLPPHFEWLKKNTRIPPTLNQFEISPLNSQKRLIQYCKDHEIQPEAMSTFSHFKSSVPRVEIFSNPLLVEIADKHKVSVPQVVNRWLLQQHISIVPKSQNPAHIAENIDLFAFHLNDDEMQTIDSLDKGKFLNYNPCVATYSVPKDMKDNIWFRDNN
ncbi:MAG: aldo/keto reductase [Bacteroides sp.]|nr:aldo/keto reductase [Bacteroides sp.]